MRGVVGGRVPTWLGATATPPRGLRASDLAHRRRGRHMYSSSAAAAHSSATAIAPAAICSRGSSRAPVPPALSASRARAATARMPVPFVRGGISECAAGARDSGARLQRSGDAAAPGTALPLGGPEDIVSGVLSAVVVGDSAAVPCTPSRGRCGRLARMPMSQRSSGAAKGCAGIHCGSVSSSGANLQVRVNSHHEHEDGSAR